MTPEPMDLRIAVPRGEVLRALGYPRDRGPRPQVERRVAALWPSAIAWLHPRGAAGVIEREALGTAGLPGATPLVGIGLATIGSALEEEASRRASRGAALDAMVLDAIGSVAADAAAGALDAMLCAHARGLGLAAAPRVSPGYGDWPLASQPALIALLPARALGVRLTEGHVMVPRKSVSFAVRLGPGPDSADSARRGCDRCGMLDCARRVPE